MKTIFYKLRLKYFSIALVAVMIFLQSSQVFALPFVTEYPVPSATHSQDSLKQIVSHPNGDLWFTMGSPANMVGKIDSSSGVVTEYTIPSAVSSNIDNLGGLTVAPDGDVWLRAKSENRIARINVTTGTIQEYTVTGSPYALTFGPDGDLWYTGTSRRVGKINITTGVVTEYTTPVSCTVGDIVSGPDNYLWYTADCSQDRVGKVNPSTGAITEYPISGDSAAFSKIRYLTSAPDGNLWFTYKLGFAKIDPDTGVISTYNIPGGSWTVAQSNVSFATPMLVQGDDLSIFLPYEGKTFSVDVYTGTVTDQELIDCASNTVATSVFDAGGSLWYTSPYCISRQDVVTTQKIDYLYEENYAGGMHIPITTGTDGNIWSTNPFSGSIVKLVPPTHTITTTSGGLQSKLVSSTSTNISCSSNVQESSFVVGDPSYNYPLGMLDFCIDVDTGGSTELTVTFETDLMPTQVVARKYNSVTGQYKTVTDAVITETTINDSHALAITYNVVDGGEYDDDGVANGTILDPIGLGMPVLTAAATTTPAALSDTGQNSLHARNIAYIPVGLSLFGISRWYIKKRYRH